MSRFWNKRTAALSPYTPGEQPKDGETFIKLNTNECPYPPSPRVTDAIAAANNSLLRLYPDPDAAAVRRAFARLNGIDPEQVFVGNGSDEVSGLFRRRNAALSLCFVQLLPGILRALSNSV